jgi:hypothetical protein
LPTSSDICAVRSFISVTQQFNTTSSMGRLTLNVLLSFAQFEREVTGERIRDKIAASKKKGMWMGGQIPLGYDLEKRKLPPNHDEAAFVCRIFNLYLELGCVVRLAAQLRQSDVKTKVWNSKRGMRLGGGPSAGDIFTTCFEIVFISARFGIEISGIQENTRASSREESGTRYRPA